MNTHEWRASQGANDAALPTLISFDDLATSWTPPTLVKGPIVARDGSTTVAIYGEQLDEVWWSGHQWAVTRYGIECRDGTYAIDAKRLRESLPEHSWVRQVGQKNWCDVDDFATAFLVACTLHGVRVAQKDRAIIMRHVAECRGYSKTYPVRDLDEEALS